MHGLEFRGIPLCVRQLWEGVESGMGIRRYPEKNVPKCMVQVAVCKYMRGGFLCPPLKGDYAATALSSCKVGMWQPVTTVTHPAVVIHVTSSTPTRHVTL